MDEITLATPSPRVTAVCVLSHFSRVRVHDPVDWSPPGSSVHGILQARLLQWVAVTSSRGSSWPRDQTCVSCVSCTGRWVLYHWCHLGNPLGWLGLSRFAVGMQNDTSSLRHRLAVSHTFKQAPTIRPWYAITKETSVCTSAGVLVGEGNGTPLQYSCLENPHGLRSLVGCSPWGR